MLSRTCGIVAVAVLASLLGCVEVPDTIRAQFAGPGSSDRTNYRPGNHGAEPAPVAKASTASTTTTTAADAQVGDASAAPASEADGGAQ
jgi:hypothetical protein